MNTATLRRCAVVRLLQCLVGCLTALSTWAAQVPTADELMDWAEREYAAHFPSRRAAQVYEQYRYRYYPETGNYLAVSGSGVWVMGPVAGSATIPLYVGEVSSFACRVFPASCAPADYPTRPLMLIVPATAGTLLDQVARGLAAALQVAMGQAISVQNLGGFAGTLGGRYVRDSLPDGYTLLVSDMTLAVVESIYRSPPMRPLDDLAPVGLLADAPMAMVGRASLPAGTVAELISWAQQAGGGATIGRAGLGSPSHLCALQWKNATSTRPLTVSYKSVDSMMSDIRGRQIDLGCAELPFVGPAILDGAVRHIGVTSASRTSTAAYAGLPTLHEGGLAGFAVGNWYGVYAPRGTPGRVIDVLAAALQRVRADPAFQQHLSSVAISVVENELGSPTSLRQRLEAEVARWKVLVREAGEYAD